MAYKETEVKLYIKDLDRLAERLRVCGADLTRQRMLERNLRLDTPERSLQEEKRLLRLREDDQVRITYKDNARYEGGVVTRTEIELTCDDFSMARMLFESLGYQVTMIYEKYRREFRIGDVIVTLDELPFGDFVEIEAENKTLIDGVAQMLGLSLGKGIETNYLGLFDIAKKNANLPFNDLTFKNFEDIHLTPQDLEVEPADA